MKWILLAVMATGCVTTTPPWQLDHDRVIAVRATPPHIPAGGRADLDVLTTAMGGDGPEVVPPMVVQGPPGMEQAVIHDVTGWAVIAPDEATLAAMRTAQGLDPDAPVALQVGLAVKAGATDLAAIKTIWMGDEADNPALGDVTIDGQPAADGLVLPTGVEIEMTIDADDKAKIDWLSSVGDLSDINDTLGHLTAKDAADGYVAVVERNTAGGVVWGYWAVSAQ